MKPEQLDRTRILLRETIARAGPAELAGLQALDELFDEPARIAIAGMVNAGKSTLLNALVGERVAPTDAGECTRIPTWYRRGRHYEVRAVDDRGAAGSALSFERGDELVVDLANREPDTVDHLIVACPTTRLSNQTLIDLPGHSSLSPDVAARAQNFLTADEGAPVDGVVYLLRHRHPADLDFLESFHEGVAGRGAVGSVAVLSRADESFGGDENAMANAGLVAERLAQDRRLRGLCQDVVPVAGLLAESAASLRNDEYLVFRDVAAFDSAAVDFALTSVDRFRALDDDTDAIERRSEVLDRFGLFGVRSAVAFIREDPDRSADAVAEHLMALSGIGALRSALDTVVHQRVLDLRARAVLDHLARLPLVYEHDAAFSELERLRANAHGLRELEAAEILRRGRVPGIGEGDADELQRLLGVKGTGVHDRLGAARSTDRAELRSRVVEEHRRWTNLSEGPLVAPLAAHLAMTGVRTCESLLADELAEA